MRWGLFLQRSDLLIQNCLADLRPLVLGDVDLLSTLVGESDESIRPGHEGAAVIVATGRHEVGFSVLEHGSSLEKVKEQEMLLCISSYYYNILVKYPPRVYHMLGMLERIKPVVRGGLASVMLLALYFAILTLVSGWSYTLIQFGEFWYFITALSLGFGIQVGLYTYIKQLVHGDHNEKKVLGVTGTTSTVAMISCCSHYLVNILPILGAVGVVTLVAQYQVEFFWIGIAFNLAGMLYLIQKITKIKKS